MAAEHLKALKQLQPAATGGRIHAEVVDDANDAFWHVTLKYFAPGAAPAGAGGWYAREPTPLRVVRLSVDLSEAVRPSSAAGAPGGLPKVGIVAPRLQAPFIFFGALCLADDFARGFAGGRAPTATVITALVETVYDRLSPTDGAVTVDAGGASYTSTEHDRGQAHILVSHPELRFASGAASAGGAPAAAAPSEGVTLDATTPTGDVIAAVERGGRVRVRGAVTAGRPLSCATGLVLEGVEGTEATLTAPVLEVAPHAVSSATNLALRACVVVGTGASLALSRVTVAPETPPPMLLEGGAPLQEVLLVAGVGASASLTDSALEVPSGCRDLPQKCWAAVSVMAHATATLAGCRLHGVLKACDGGELTRVEDCTVTAVGTQRAFALHVLRGGSAHLVKSVLRVEGGPGPAAFVESAKARLDDCRAESRTRALEAAHGAAVTATGTTFVATGTGSGNDLTPLGVFCAAHASAILEKCVFNTHSLVVASAALSASSGGRIDATNCEVKKFAFSLGAFADGPCRIRFHGGFCFGAGCAAQAKQPGSVINFDGGARVAARLEQVLGIITCDESVTYENGAAPPPPPPPATPAPALPAAQPAVTREGDAAAAPAQTHAEGAPGEARPEAQGWHRYDLVLGLLAAAVLLGSLPEMWPFSSTK